MSTVTVTLDSVQIRKALSRKIVDCPEKEVLLDAIIGIIDDANRLDKLVSGLFGAIPKTKFSKDAEVFVKRNALSDHLFDTPAMLVQKRIIDDKVKARIKEVNPWGNPQYKVVYEYISSIDGIVKEGINSVWESYIELAEEFPEDLF